VHTICTPWQGDTSADCSHRYIMSSVNYTVDLKLNIRSEEIQNLRVNSSFIRVHHTVTAENTFYLLMQCMLGNINRDEITSIQCGFVTEHSKEI